MEKNNKFLISTCLLFLMSSLFLVSCGKDDGVPSIIARLPNEMNGVGGFFKITGILLVIQILLNVLAAFFTKSSVSFLVSLILCIVIIIVKDYGFFTTLLSFLIQFIVIKVISFIIADFM
ncbi:hypothetical protein [Chryseobacterium sp. MP_3.2]|uniref:hypothetical protein n=1 Tax=Chryseobacterium sp. MP_3.2 TaxID=3071712 RepID=UPI002DFAAA2D|nr:hypothetical protein [Chryseobacterium sp. MP_3.2]